MSHKIGNDTSEDNSYTFIESNINNLNTKYKQTHTHMEPSNLIFRPISNTQTQGNILGVLSTKNR